MSHISQLHDKQQFGFSKEGHKSLWFFFIVLLHAGEVSDTTQPMNCSCSIVYGSRFEYDDTEFVSLVQGQKYTEMFNLQAPCIRYHFIYSLTLLI